MPGALSELSVTRMDSLSSSEWYIVLYLDPNGIRLRTIEFMGDTQTLNNSVSLTGSTPWGSIVRRSLNMDCLDNPTGSGFNLCLITYTLQANPTAAQNIFIELFGGNKFIHLNPGQVASLEGTEQFNSMVALTDEFNFVTTFIRIDGGK